MKLLSRNTPIAFVVGAAGFLGSHVTEKLLAKKVQVVGVDDFSSGSADNLIEATKSKSFYFFNQSVSQKINLTFPRLDYAFFILPENLPPAVYQPAVDNFLKICQEFKAKTVFVSSIDLYDSHPEKVHSLKEEERRVAQFSTEHKLNARVVRLAALYGPRMHFRQEDPIIRLIRAAVLGELQKELTALDFSTRAIYVEDAVTLLLKTVMHGATAQKIYDGALPTPVKVAEIKQVLLDPVWHENRGFAPTELPPWPTPNLEKTMKELGWKADTSIVTSLRETMHFFTDNPKAVEKAKREQLFGTTKRMESRVAEESEEKNQPEEVKESKKRLEIPKPQFGSKEKWERGVKIILSLALISYALIYPLLGVGLGVYRINSYMEKGGEQFKSGNLISAQFEIDQAKRGVSDFRQTLDSLDFISRAGIFTDQWQGLRRVLEIVEKSTLAADHTVSGVAALSAGLTVVSGEKEGNSQLAWDTAVSELTLSEQGISEVRAKLLDDEYWAGLPGGLRKFIQGWGTPLADYQQEIGGGRDLTYLLSQIVAPKDSKKYLVVLQDNTTLRPGGGVITAYAELNFDRGKLVNLKTGGVSSLESSVAAQINPPKEIESDLGVTALSFKDTAFEADVPTNLRLAQWLYDRSLPSGEGQESKVRTAGIFSFDLTAVENLLDVFGPITLVDINETVNSKNLTERFALYPDKQKFGSLLMKEVLQRLFFLSKHNWSELTLALENSLAEKHLLMYYHDATLFSYVKSAGWSGVMPRQIKEGKGERWEFLGVSESNIGTVGSNKGVRRSWSLEDSISGDGVVRHKLTVRFMAEPGSNFTYRNRLKIYLAAGSKLTKASWGEDDITSTVTSFSDYGRAGYSTLLLLGSEDPKSLIFEYEDSQPLEFNEENLKYHIDLLKQPGTGSDPFEFKLHLPESIAIVSPSSQESLTSLSTDLSRDRAIEIKLKKISN